MDDKETTGKARGRRREPIATARPATRALVIVPYGPTHARGTDDGAVKSTRSPQARLVEAVGLAAAIELVVVDSLLVPVGQVRPATYLGKGKIEQLARMVTDGAVDLVTVDTALSPVQQRNLEKELGAKVIDRTGLILEIFGRRARTREGVLQVELAHLSYQRSRLVRSWTHLERQRGGFGFLGGPGESQIEIDRRLIDDRIAKVERALEGVKRTRKLHRLNRKKVPYPIIALVGYTNAGKSTLFNRLTSARVLAKDLLFATLDPTLRVLDLPAGTKSILSDTVGFISDLPTHLIAAFRATLEEVLEADIILHVRDIAHEDTAAQAADVAAVLKTLDIDAMDTKRVIEVWNKADLLDAANRERVENQAARAERDRSVFLVSAIAGDGLDALLQAIEERLGRSRTRLTVRVPSSDGAGLHWLYTNTEVVDKRYDAAGDAVVTVHVAPERAPIITSRFHILHLRAAAE